jgi:predicted AAA+ superfamily ATPase
LLNLGPGNRSHESSRHYHSLVEAEYAGTQIKEMAAQAKPMPRGAFIVIEGLDRSGKTTQVKILEAELLQSGKKVKTIHFPGKLAKKSVLAVDISG